MRPGPLAAIAATELEGCSKGAPGDEIELKAGSSMEESVSETSQFANMPKGRGAHPIVWLELTTNNAEGFQLFYGSLFSWTFMPFAKDYFLYQSPKGLMGVVRLNAPEGTPPAVYFIYASDINAKLA